MSGTIWPGVNSYMTINALNLTNSAASDISMKIGNDEAEAAMIGDNWKQYAQGQAEATFDASGVWDAGTAAAALDAILFGMSNAGGTKLFEFCPQGSASNRVKYTGNALSTGYQISAPVKGIVGFTLGLRSSGSVTRSTIT